MSRFVKPSCPSRPSWRATTYASLCLVPFVGLVVTSCADTQNTKQMYAVHQSSANLTPLPSLSDPSQAVIKGQQNALLHFMARKWQLKSINHIPTAQDVVIDLTNFAHATGQAHTDCDEIVFEFDASKVLSGKLSVLSLERKLHDCTHNMGDDLMRILGDLHSFSHQGDVLTLISLKDTMELVAIP